MSRYLPLGGKESIDTWSKSAVTDGIIPVLSFTEEAKRNHRAEDVTN